MTDSTELLTQAPQAKTSADVLALEDKGIAARGAADAASKTAQADIDLRQAQGEQGLAESEAAQARALQTQRDAGIRQYEEFHPTKENGTDLAQMFSLIASLGFMSGGAGRAGALGAMKNMTSAMQGYQDGRQDLFQREMQEFEKNLQSAKLHNDQIEKQYRDGLDLLPKDRNAGLAKLKVAAAQEHNQSVLPTLIQTGQIDEAVKMLDHRRTALEKLEQHKADLAQRFQQQKMLLDLKESFKKAEAAAPIASDTVDFFATQSLAGDNSWQVGLARGKAGQALIAAVKDRIPKMAAEMGLSPQDVSTNKGQMAALTKTLSDRQKYVTAVEQLNGTLDKQADLVESLLAKGAANGQSPVLNKWIQAGRHATGDPDVDALDVAITGLAREHQRVLTAPQSTGQLHVSSQETADRLVNKAQTPEQIRAVIGVMKKEAANGLEQGRSTLESLRKEMKNMAVPQKSESNGATQQFSSEADAEAAFRSGRLKKGDRITINGQTGTWQ